MYMPKQASQPAETRTAFARGRRAARAPASPLVRAALRRAAYFCYKGKTILSMPLSECHRLCNIPIERGLEVSIRPEFLRGSSALLMSLLRVVELDPDGLVCLMPVHRFVSDDLRLVSHMRRAASAIEHRRLDIVVLGVEPIYADPNQWWMLGDSEAVGPRPRRAELIPPCSPKKAEELMSQGAYWSTGIVLFRARAMLGLYRRAMPDFEHVVSELLFGGWDAMTNILGKEQTPKLWEELLPLAAEDLRMLPAPYVAVRPHGPPLADAGGSLGAEAFA